MLLNPVSLPLLKLIGEKTIPDIKTWFYVKKRVPFPNFPGYQVIPHGSSMNIIIEEITINIDLKIVQNNDSNAISEHCWKFSWGCPGDDQNFETSQNINAKDFTVLVQ